MRTHTKTGTVALLVSGPIQGELQVLETLSDEEEIALLESALRSGNHDPLPVIQAHRLRLNQEDEEFGNYVEDLLTQPFVRPEVQEHGIQWLRSRMRIEAFQKSEREATQVISEYALKIFRESPWRTEFFLSGPTAKVKVRIFALSVEGAVGAA